MKYGLSIESSGREALGYFVAGTFSGVLVQVIRMFVFAAGQVIASLSGILITAINLLFGGIFLVVSILGFLSELEEFLYRGWLFTPMVAVIAFISGDSFDGMIAALTLAISSILSALRSYAGSVQLCL